MKARRIVFRERRVKGKLAEYAYFYESGISSNIISARLRRDVVSDIIDYLGLSDNISWSKSGRTLYLGDGGDTLFRLLAVLASLTHCSRKPIYTATLVGALREVGEYAILFWYGEVIKRRDEEGYRGVCRVARAFRTLYRI